MGQENRRLRPYSVKQLQEAKCHRCGAPARFQWNACADGNVWRPLCDECDVVLNEMVVAFLDPEGWVTKVARYCKQIGFKWTRPSRDWAKLFRRKN